MTYCKLHVLYRLLILTAFMLIFGCQAPPDEDKNVLKPPDWIKQKDKDEFHGGEYYASVGVSDESYEDARSRAFEGLDEYLHPYYAGVLYPTDEFKEKIYSLVSDDYKNYVEPHEVRFIFDNEDDIHNALFAILLEKTQDEAAKSEYPSWAELYTFEEKRYSDGFTYYVRIKFDLSKCLKDPAAKLLRLQKKNTDLAELDFEDTLEALYANIELHHKAWHKFIYSSLQGLDDYEDSEREKDKTIKAEYKKNFEALLLSLLKDLEVRFSEDNVKGWRDKFTDKIDIQIFWKKNLIKVPMRFETSTDAQVELIASTKRDISYELRVMPRSESDRTNAAGQHFVEFDLKPKDLRFSKLINFALKKKFHFTLPTKKNSYFQFVVNPEVLDNASVTKRQFADNLCSELNNSLALWCKNKKYMVSDPTQTRAQTQQTQIRQNRYDFKVVVDFVDSDIAETRGKKILTVDLDLKLMYFDDSLDTPAWVRLKQDSYKFSDVLITDSKIDDSSMFVLYCVGLFQDPDFEKVIADLFKRAHS